MRATNLRANDAKGLRDIIATKDTAAAKAFRLRVRSRYTDMHAPPHACMEAHMLSAPSWRGAGRGPHGHQLL